MGIGLFDNFEMFATPLIIEGAKILLNLCMVGGAWIIMRCNSAEGFKRIKYGTLGYTIIRITSLYIKCTDKFIDNAMNNFISR